MLLYIIRHGEPNYDTDRLTPTGWKQAEALAPRMVAARPDFIYSSPMGRAIETSEPTCRALGMTRTVLPWAHEIGEERITTFVPGKTMSISLVPSYYARLGDEADLSYAESPYGKIAGSTKLAEEIDYIGKNADRLLERHGYRREGNVYRAVRPNDEKIALFCHACLGRVLLCHFLHLPVQLAWSIMDISFTGVTVLEFRNYDDYPEGLTAPRMLTYGDLSHLYAAEGKLLYNNRLEI